ncbi:MAG: polynucleotide adenylyltransferase [Patescibacteria group bacterium]|nr:polynucleotide adenylyltransferase [Patescibacteria group bacterium]
MKFEIPQNVSRVTETLKAAGYDAYLVGGCVRDFVMGKVPKDFDITTNAKPEDIVKLFEGKEEDGIKVVYENTFGTVAVVFENEPHDSNVRQIEITPYRRETTYSDNRHPDAIEFAEKLSDDLMRRDFTMNALAYDPVSHETTDFYNGLADIKNKIIRTVGEANERFNEDALRMMRAVRFAAQLGFAVSHETLDAILKKKNLLANVSQERIRDEFVKMVNSNEPAIGIGLMKQLGILEMILPEIMEGDGCEQGGVHKFDVFTHLVMACQHAADKNFSFHVRLAALFHDIGKPRTRRPGTKKEWTFYGHEVVGARMAQKIMERMKFSKADTDMVVKLVRYHMFFSDTETITLSPVRRIIANIGADNIWELMKIRECDRVGMSKPEAPYRLRKYHAMIEECLRDPISVSQLKIDGHYLMKDLGVKPGPRMGWMLHALLEEVLEDPAKNTVETLSSRVRELEHLSDAELRALGEAGKEAKEELEEEEVKKLHVKHGVK